MKVTKVLISLSLWLVLALALPGPALAADGSAKGLPDEFVFGENYTLAGGETLDGNLWVFGGNATLEEGSTVTGDVMVFGGNLIADGTIEGDVNMTGGSVMLGSTAVVQGDVNVTGGSLNRDSGARVEGSVNENFRGPFRFSMPRGLRLPGVNVPWPEVDIQYPFWGVLSYFFRAFLVSALAVLLAMFWPRQIARTGEAVLSQPLIAGGMGLVTIIVAPIVLLGLAITILLIPVSFLGFLLLGVMIVFGWIAIGLEVGKRMAQTLFRTEWTLPVAAGLGTLLLTLVVDGIGQIWCVGWIAPALVGLLGLGGVLLTRFGTQPYSGPAASAIRPMTPAPAEGVPPETRAAEGGAQAYPPSGEEETLASLDEPGQPPENPEEGK